MLLGEVFDRFAAESPVSVMARAAFEHALPAGAVDALFAEYAERQYTRELLFSQLVDLMGLVVCRIQPSLNAAIRKRAGDLGVTRKAVYAKVARTEPGLGAALVRHTAARLGPVVAALGPTAEEPVPGYRVRVIDGSHLPGTEHRRRPLRRTRAGALPGQAVVLFEPATGLVLDAIPCEDGHAQERSLTPAILGWAEPATVWVGDRNFCTTRLLAGTAGRGGCFVVRQHGLTLTEFGVGDRAACGRTDTGAVFEEAVRVSDGAGGELTLRRVTVVLDTPTRDGDREIRILTNLPAAVPADRVAELYRGRWGIEKNQADCPSSRRWVGSRRIGYHRRDGVARAGRVVPPAPGRPHRRSRMPDTTRRLAPPPRLTPATAPTSDPPPVWAHLPADRQKQLHDLLGQLLARLHAARSRKEAGHD